MKVLVAEDELVALKIIETMLTRHGYETVLAHTGRQALEALEAHDDIGLVITDLKMPEIDGMELICEMKERDDWKHIPIIVSTVLAEVDTVERATKLGCTHYLVKPISEVQLMECVQEARESARPVRPVALPTVAIESAKNGNPHENPNSELAEVLENKIQLLERLIRGEAAAEESQGLFELALTAPFIGAKNVSGILDSLASKNNKGDQRALTGDFLLLLKELTILQQALVR